MPAGSRLNNFLAPVKAVLLQQSGANLRKVTPSRVFLRALHFADNANSTPSVVEFRNGDASGEVCFAMETQGKGTSEDIIIPAGGIYFEEGIYADMGELSSLTIMYSFR